METTAPTPTAADVAKADTVARAIGAIYDDAPLAVALAEERARVVRLFLDLAADLEDAATTPRPGVRDGARFAAYEDVAHEMRTLAAELGVTA